MCRLSPLQLFYDLMDLTDWLFMASFIRIITVILFVYGFELILRFSIIFTVMDHDGLLLGKTLPDVILGSSDDAPIKMASFEVFSKQESQKL